MAVYYNENDKNKCHVLRQLISDGVIPHGDIDDRDIREINADEISGYTQCHFFTGWGGWPLALKIAGWPDHRPVWTGSCPCQPYSIIGGQEAQQDDRDLWPIWESLMGDYVPIIFGEQVANAIQFGWYDRVADDMARNGKSCWAAVLPACSTGQGNKGERLFFVAAPPSSGLERYIGNEHEIIKKSLQTRYSAEAGVCNFIKGWDGLHRPYNPEIPMLDNGISGRFLRFSSEGIGDSINPQVASEFIKTFMEIWG